MKIENRGKYANNVFRELQLMGYPLPFSPRDVTPGPFNFVGNIPDNTTAPIDLTTAAAMAEDMQLTQILGATNNDPRVMLYITGAKIFFDFSAEPLPDVVLQAYRSRLYLEMNAHGDERRIHPLGPDLADAREAVAVAADANGAPTNVVSTVGRGEPYQRFIYPWIVDLSVDLFQVSISVATNTAGPVPFKLELYGAAWQSQTLSGRDFRDVCGQPENGRAVIESSLLAQTLGRR
jgi:hypothetical protein